MLINSVDTITIQFLIDNAVDSLSSGPSKVSTAWQQQIANGAKVLSGCGCCCAIHGLSILVTVQAQGNQKQILFDMGPHGQTLIDNCHKLSIEFNELDAMMFSHGHFDHVGGILAALALWSKHHPNKKIPVYLNHDMFVRRAVAFNDTVVDLEPLVAPDIIEQAGAKIINTGKKPHSCLDDLFYISGEIERKTPYEEGMINHLKYNQAQSTYEPDPLILDERFLMVILKNKGLVIFSACSHAGIVNVVNQAAKDFPDIPIYAVIGGFHLSGKAMEEKIIATINDLQTFDIPLIIPGHCTGYRAQSALLNTMGESIVIPSAVGKKFLLPL